jgi:hypothetical protein
MNGGGKQAGTRRYLAKQPCRFNKTAGRFIKKNKDYLFFFL